MNQIFNFYNHPFHMVTNSPWPLLMSISLLNLVLSLLSFFLMNKLLMLLLSLILNLLIVYQWWRDVIRESTYQGCHSFFVLNMIKFGMVLFIISEVFFFFSFFWTYIHNAISPDIELGMMWPPLGIELFDPFSIPLLNSLILISSGFSITWSHYNLLIGNLYLSSVVMFITIILGVIFSIFQLVEYYDSMFSINDGVYGSIFFMMTGFHGIHVIIGSIFLFIVWIRLIYYHFSKIHHLNFEIACWYWHFVDVVWLMLYLMVYWWVW